MKTFFDSSAFANRYVEEPGSDTVAALCQEATDLALCVICVPEIVSAMNRRLRERRLTKSDYLSLKRHLLEDIRDATIIACLLIMLYTGRRPSIAIFEAVCFYLLGWASLEDVESRIAKTPISA